MDSETDQADEASGRSSSLSCNGQHPEKEFIIKFEALPALWDTTNPQYTNKFKRNENLAKLLLILKQMKPNATIEDVKKKINIIRSNYRRELKKIRLSKRSGVGTKEIYTPKIWYFPYLNFLRKLEHQEPLQESETTHKKQSAPEKKYTNQKTSKESTPKKFLATAVSKRSDSSATKEKKINRNELLEYACQCLSEACTQNSQLNSPDPIALEWSNTLDRLDPLQRIYAKKAINDILFEAELSNLNRNSVKINDTASLSSQITVPMTDSSTQNHGPSSHYSSPINSTITSPPHPSSPVR